MAARSRGRLRAGLAPIAAAAALLVAACQTSATPPSAVATAPAAPAAAAPGSGAQPAAQPAASSPAASTPAPGVPLSQGGPLQKIAVGYLALNATQLPSWVAKDEGIFQKNGLDVTLNYLPTSSSPTAALLSGQVQFLVTAEQVIEADLNGADLVYVAAPTQTIFFSLYVNPSIKSAADLKGKKVAITGVGTATDIAAHMALTSLGVDPAKDVTLVNIGSAPSILAALQSGGVQAGILSSPTSYKAEAAGMKQMVDVAKLNKPFPSGWAATSRAYAQAHPDVVSRYVKSIAEAVAFEIHHSDQAEQVLAKYTKTTDAAIVKRTFDDVKPYLNKDPTPDLNAIQTALTEIAPRLPKARTAQPSTFVDSSFAQQLVTSGFIKSLYP